MRRLRTTAGHLVPTDHPRTLAAILKPIRRFCEGRRVEPVVAVPYTSVLPGDSRATRYYVCQGNHRTAAAFICGVELDVRVVERVADLKNVSQGTVAECASVEQLAESCFRSAEAGNFIKGGWQEYLRMITDSGCVAFDDE